METKTRIKSIKVYRQHYAVCHGDQAASRTAVAARPPSWSRSTSGGRAFGAAARGESTRNAATRRRVPPGAARTGRGATRMLPGQRAGLLSGARAHSSVGGLQPPATILATKPVVTWSARTSSVYNSFFIGCGMENTAIKEV